MKQKMPWQLTVALSAAGALLFAIVFAMAMLKPAMAETVNTSVDEQAGDATRALLKQIAEQAILPMYVGFSQASKQQVEQAEALCAKPTAENVAAMRTAWSDALSAWQQTDALLFGPAIEEQIDFGIYFLPAKKSIIKGVLKAQDRITTETLEQAGVGAQGFGTLEYLLFDREKNIDFSDDVGKKRCEHVLAASQLIHQHAEVIDTQWQKRYAEAFYTAGAGSTEFLEAEQPLEILVNKVFQTVEKVSGKKLAIPLDKKNNGEHVNAYKLEAWRGGHTLQNIQANILGMKRIIVDGGITEWLQAHGQKELAEKLEKQFTLLLDYAFASDDLFSLLEKDEAVADEFYAQCKVLTQLIKRELAPAMNVQLGFNDNDGD